METYAKTIIEGHILDIVKKEYEGKLTYRLQFLAKSAKGMEVLNVKLVPEQDVSTLKPGIAVTVPISVSAFNNALFYTQIGKIQVLQQK